MRLVENYARYAPATLGCSITRGNDRDNDRGNAAEWQGLQVSVEGTLRPLQVVTFLVVGVVYKLSYITYV